MAGACGGFRAKCVKKWNLQLSVDDKTREEEWKNYYVERDALEQKHARFQEKPSRMLRDLNFCDCCFDVYTDEEGILDNVYDHLNLMRGKLNEFGMSDLGSHLYTLKLHLSETDDQNPRDIDLRSRLYSPFSSSSLEFTFTYHYRTRLSGTEDFHFLNIAQRTAEDLQPNQPFSSVKQNSAKCMTFMESVFEEGRNRKPGVIKRSMRTLPTLKKLQYHIFGKPTKESLQEGHKELFPRCSRDMGKILLVASGVELLKVLRLYMEEDAQPSNIGWMDRYVESNFEGEHLTEDLPQSDTPDFGTLIIGEEMDSDFEGSVGDDHDHDDDFDGVSCRQD